MKTDNIMLRSLEAEEGMWLTNGETISKKVYLGINDSPENWREITDTEAKEIKEKLGIA